MINAFKYAIKKMVESNGSGYLMADYVAMIEEIQKDSYNQAIEDSKLKIKYDFRETTVDTPTNNASYYSRSEMFMDFMSNYEDSIRELKIK